MDFYLPHLKELGFLPPVQEEGVFLCFPVEARNSLAKLLCDNINLGKVQATHFSTPVHVRTILESIGQCFSLPLEFSSTIESALQIYRIWLIDQKKQPTPIKEDEQFFYKEMFKHLSLIFTPRTFAELTVDSKITGREHLHAVNEDIAQHTKFCKTALNIYRSVGVKYARQLTYDTWECLLKVVLGIADSMLGEPRGTSMVTEQLVCDLINILFELWLTSGRRPPAMWNKLSELTKRWKHRIQIFSYWSATCSAINQRVLQILYGPSHGTDAILFPRVDKTEIVPLYLGDSYVITCWYRMLHLLGSFEGTVAYSENYFEAIKGIGNIACSYIELVDKKLFNNEGSPIPPPTGNTILDMCGGWLFEAINNFQKGFENGKKKALKTICKLFCSRSSSEFHDKYLAHYYRGIEKALNTHNTPLLDVILRSSVPFFLKQYRGSHVLIPSYVITFGRVLFSDAQGSVAKEISVVQSHSSQAIDLERLQKASLQIIYSLISLGNHYKDCVFNCSSTQSVPLLETLPTLKKFSNLNEHIGELLLAALLNVGSVECRIMAMWGACMFSYEVIDVKEFGPKYTTRLLSLLLEKLISNQWDNKEVSCAFMILRDASWLFPYLGNGIALKVVTTSCTFIGNILSKLATSEEESLIFLAMETCLSWCLVDQWIQQFPECIRVVISTIEKGIKFPEHPNSRATVGKKIKSASEYFLFAFVNYFAHFPLVSGPDNISSLRNEASLIQESCGDLVQKSVSCFALNSSAFTVCKFPKKKGTEVYCVTRDMLGRNIWRNKMNYFIEPIVEVSPTKFTSISPSEIPSPVKIDDVNKELYSSMTDADRRLHEETLKFVLQNNETEKQILEKRKYGLDIDVSMENPRPSYDPDDASLRLFYSNFGLNSLPNWNNLLPFETKFDKCDNLTIFQQSDKLSARGCYSAGILYFDGKSTTPIFDLEVIPESFTEFIWSLGWKIDIATHTGYKGVLASGKTGKYAPYFSTYNLELIFQVGLFIPKSQIKSNYMQSLIFSNQVVICWTENIEEFDPSIFKTEFQVLIVIEPQVTRLYRVKVFTPELITDLGPLQDEMIVSKQILGVAVRNTVLNVYRCESVCGEHASHRITAMGQEITKIEAPKDLFNFHKNSLTV